MNAALDRVLVGPRASRVRFGDVLLVALVSHLVVGFAAASTRRVVSAPPRETSIQALPDEPPPPPEPPPTLEAEKVAPPTPAPAPVPNAPPAAPPPAAAANVMTAPDDAPVDMTGGVVVGSAETYAGGTVSAASTGTRAGSPGRVAGSVAGTGTASAIPPPKGPDLSRAPRLAEGQSWSCPFPAEADEQGIDTAVVGLVIEVTADGEVSSSSVERDPGNGFGRVAVTCARSKRFAPAEDRDGKRVPGRSRVNVRFQR